MVTSTERNCPGRLDPTGLDRFALGAHGGWAGHPTTTVCWTGRRGTSGSPCLLHGDAPDLGVPVPILLLEPVMYPSPCEVGLPVCAARWGRADR